MTAALANGRDLYAFRFAANDRSNSLNMQSRERHRHRLRTLDLQPAN
jgi:hypothetical protein